MKLSEKVRSLLGTDTPEPQTKLAYLSVVDVFQDLTPDERQEVAKAAQMTTCPAGRLFYSPDQFGEVIFILKKGRVQLYRMSSEGRKLVIDTLGPGTLFGEMSLVGTGLHDAFAEAVEESLICVMNRRDIEKLILSKPQVAIRLLDLMAKRLRESEERLEQTLFHEVPSQLAALILRLGAEGVSETIQTTHEELAEQLGVYRETVTTALNKLKNEGLVSTSRKRIVITDIEGLENRAAG